jgi:hypothetical protein
MGLAPTFKATSPSRISASSATFSFPMCISTKFALGFKNEDFAIPEFDFSAFDPGNGNVMTWGTSE